MRRAAPPFPQILRFAGLTAPARRILIVGAALALMLALRLFLEPTWMGATIVASAQNRTAAALGG